MFWATILYKFHDSFTLQERRETEQVLANPILPEHVLDEAVPGSIRLGILFLKLALIVLG